MDAPMLVKRYAVAAPWRRSATSAQRCVRESTSRLVQKREHDGRADAEEDEQDGASRQSVGLIGQAIDRLAVCRRADGRFLLFDIVVGRGRLRMRWRDRKQRGQADSGLIEDLGVSALLRHCSGRRDGRRSAHNTLRAGGSTRRSRLRIFGCARHRRRHCARAQQRREAGLQTRRTQVIRQSTAENYLAVNRSMARAADRRLPCRR